jgi:uncharacterized protein YjbJ (UPF0337 family)
MWGQNNYSPASDSTYYYFDGAVMRLSTFRVYRSRPRPDTVAAMNGTNVRSSENVVMDRDRIAGAAKEIKGSVKETVGKAVGDAKLQSDGKADKVEGKVQNAIGGLKDSLKK